MLLKFIKLTPALPIVIAMAFYSPVKASQNNSSFEKHNLMQFTYANCMFWYFKSKNYAIKDIQAISGGFVEMGSSSIDKYQAIALFMKNYKTKRKTKQNVDPNLLKCFYLEQNDELNKLIDSML